MLLRGANGTGKTLAYLLPVLNNLYNVQENQADLFPSGGVKRSISRENEDEMFQNANQLLHAARKHKTNELGPLKGAIIVSRSKELINQIYAQARLLDTQNSIRVNRLASALQMNSPVVEFITPEKT